MVQLRAESGGNGLQDLILSLQKNRKDLAEAIKILKKRGIAKAEAEKNYRIELQKEMLRLKADGVPVTGMSDLARGNELVANLKMKRDIAETLYDTAKQQIYYLKIEIGIIENMMAAERKGE